MQPSEAVELRAREYVLEHGIPEYFDGENPFGEHERVILIRFPSQSQSDISHTATYRQGQIFCSCQGFLGGHMCWHLVIAEAIYNGDEPWKKRSLEDFTTTTFFT